MLVRGVQSQVCETKFSVYITECSRGSGVTTNHSNHSDFHIHTSTVVHEAGRLRRQFQLSAVLWTKTNKKLECMRQKCCSCSWNQRAKRLPVVMLYSTVPIVALKEVIPTVRLPYRTWMSASWCASVMLAISPGCEFNSCLPVWTLSPVESYYRPHWLVCPGIQMQALAVAACFLIVYL